MADCAVLNQERVRAEVNYIRNPPAPGAELLTFVTENFDQSTMITQPGVPVWINDVRGVETSLDREGFEIVTHCSHVTDFDLIEEEAEADELYSREMTALLQEMTGASRIVMQGTGKKRYGPNAGDRLAGLKNALPALYPHGDTTDASAAQIAEAFASFVPGIDLTKVGRWALFNMWRPITPPPHDYPLAVCDARTLAPDHSVAVIAHTETRAAGTFAFETRGYLFRPEHRWCYFSNMSPDEVLGFKTHDSDPARAHQVAHTAFVDPTCPAGVPTRGSVEMRAFAIFD